METSLPSIRMISIASLVCTDILSFSIRTRDEMYENEVANTSTEMRAQRLYRKSKLVA